MAVEMEEKHELVIPKPSHSWKSIGIPFGTLNYLSGFKQMAQTLPAHSANARYRKQTENQKKNLKSLEIGLVLEVRRTTCAAGEASHLFFFFLKCQVLSTTNVIAGARSDPSGTRSTPCARPSPARPLVSPWPRGRPCWDRRSQWVERRGHSAWG